MTTEPLLKFVNACRIGNDLFWLSLLFLVNCTQLKRLAGCFKSVWRFRFPVDVIEIRIWSPGRQIILKNITFFFLLWPSHKILEHDRTIPYNLPRQGSGTCHSATVHYCDFLFYFLFFYTPLQARIAFWRCMRCSTLGCQIMAFYA